MSEVRTHEGSCHCGAVRFEATTDLARVVACNCSICSRAGYVLTFVPADQFKLLSGEDNLSSYHFNKMRIDHVFCKTCGIHSFAKGTDKDGREVRAVNVRCLPEVDLDALSPTKFDGKKL